MVGIIMAFIFIFLVSPSWAQCPARTTHWAGKTAMGTGDCSSSANRGQVGDCWTVTAGSHRDVAASDILCLENESGATATSPTVYTGANSIINPPDGLSGSSGSEITVIAQNEGLVVLDGEATRTPVLLRDNAWFILEGFNACCGGTEGGHVGNVVSLSNLTSGEDPHVLGSDNNIVRKVVAWDALITNNAQVFATSSSQNVLFEDIAGFGTGRKIFQAYRSDSVTIRRAFVAWGGTTNPNIKQTIGPGYRTYDTILENVIATWFASEPGISTSNTDSVLVSGTLRENDDSFEDPARGDNANDQWFGSIIYLDNDTYNGGLRGQKIIRQGGYRNDIALTDVVSFIDVDIPGSGIRTFLMRDYTGTDGTVNLTLDNITSVYGSNSVASISADWTKTNFDEGSTLNDVSSIFTGGVGADVCFEYVDGVETATKLWPWRMNQRIIDAMNSAGKKPVDVTATIESIFGPIPSDCRKSGSSPSAPTNLRWLNP